MEKENTFVSNQDKASDFDYKCDAMPLCEPCFRNKSSKAATVFCKDCSELFCDQCSHLHTIFKPGKHDIIIVADIDSIRVVVDMKGIDEEDIDVPTDAGDATTEDMPPLEEVEDDASRMEEVD
ncbi:uncharacterized protein LOC127873489 isoform X2 [Dreissena polymorpha]|uniref:uncharacterized protein LOC127873489 isoform X2 n=1 Tax=Dreissena polymorpha TaxID=45954 RepID=UPI002263E63E|nr:uncharacterized protein LOC127873489 isoform X2 [Dreissena polymorpha]